MKFIVFSKFLVTVMMNIAVVGIGNILFKDDGLGVAAAKSLAGMPWPAGVTIYDAGTAVMSILDVFSKNQLVVIVDALKGGNEPGAIYRLTPEELGEWRNDTISLHDLQVMDIIQMAALLGNDPQVIIFGMEPAVLDMEIGLSAHIGDRLPVLVEYIRQELTQYIEKDVQQGGNS